MTSADPLGNVFARLRESVPPADAADGPNEAPTEVAAAAPTEVAAAPVPEAAIEAPMGASEVEVETEVLEYEAIVVEAIDEFDLDPVDPEPQWPVFGVAESATLDDVGLRRRRDAAIGPAAAALASRVKRRLQDEQNELLDALRRQKAKIDVDSALPSAAEQIDVWVEVLAPAVDEMYATGRVLGGGRTRPAPPRLAYRLAELFIGPLRERVLVSLDAVMREGPYEGSADLQRATSGAVGARYREWRSQDLEVALGDLLSFAFARGVYDATPDGVRLRWVPAEVEQCPDADDNALEPTIKGGPFPTGQSCPPAHPGCRCLVVPAEA